MSIPGELYGDLVALQHQCEAVLTRDEPRTLAYARVTDQRVGDLQPIAEEHSGKRPFLTFGAATLYELSGVAAVILGQLAEFDTSHPRHVVMRGTDGSPSAGAIAGHINIFEIYGRQSQELVTATAVSRYEHHEDRTHESVLLFSKANRLIRAEAHMTDRLTQNDYSACHAMFGEGSLAIDLFAGVFQDEEDLSAGLALVRESALATGVYLADDVDRIIEAIRKHGLRNRYIENLLTRERIARISEFVLSL